MSLPIASLTSAEASAVTLTEFGASPQIVKMAKGFRLQMVVSALLTFLLISRRRRRRKVLFIAISYIHHPQYRLRHPASDIDKMRNLLKEWNYDPEHVRLLSDFAEVEKDKPTRANILAALEDFVDESVDTEYLFVYAGHSDQREAPPGSQERDGMEEYIIPSDAVTETGNLEEKSLVITDSELHKYLVQRIPKGSRLTAILDTCHSETLLNLPHYKCNRCSSPMWTPRQIIRGAREFISTQPSSSMKMQTSESHCCPERASCVCGRNCQLSGNESKLVSPELDCRGYCKRSCQQPQVVCISACKDPEETMETRSGGVLITAVVKALTENSNIGVDELMNLLRKHVRESRKTLYADLKRDMNATGRLILLARVHIGRELKKRIPYPQLSTSSPARLKSMRLQLKDICKNKCKRLCRCKAHIPHKAD